MSFDLSHPAAVKYLKQRGAELISGVDETTRGYIQTIISRGAESGKGWREIAREIEERFEGFSIKPSGPSHLISRGRLVAVTELGNAYEEGVYQSALQLGEAGLEMEKAYLGPSDDRTSEACLSNLAAGWIPLEKNFPSGIPRPLNHPGCRHALALRRAR
jgi:hypothetical protein